VSRSPFPRTCAGRLDPAGLVSRVIGLDEVNEAFAAMEGGEVVRGVIRF
jgi:Zn-dependent alcohol dehydrogenase